MVFLCLTCRHHRSMSEGGRLIDLETWPTELAPTAPVEKRAKAKPFAGSRHGNTRAHTGNER
jgi:hypothetical protein